MYFDESNKLETYSYITHMQEQNKWILKNTNLFVDLPILIYVHKYIE